LINLYIKKIYNSLRKELFPTWFKALYSIFIISIFSDYIMRGKFGFIAFMRFEINNTFNGANWQFLLILIILLLMWKKK